MPLTRPRYSQIYDTDYKQSVRVATTGSSITLSGSAPNTLDGVTLALNDRILVKDQSTASQNGIYYVTTLGTGSNGTWTRALDADTSDKVTSGMTITVTEGTANGNTTWKLTTADPITLGSTNLTFANPFVVAATGGNTAIQYNFNNSLAGSANLTFNVATGRVDIKSNYATSGYTLGLIGNAVVDGNVSAQVTINSSKAYNQSPAAGISFSTKYNSAGDDAGLGGITVTKSNATDGDLTSHLTLMTRPIGGSVTERMRIDGNGNVTISSITNSTSASTGALVVTGGIGVAQDIFSSGNINIQNTATTNLRVFSNNGSAPLAQIEIMRGANTTFGGDLFTDFRFRSFEGNLLITSGHSTKGIIDRIIVDDNNDQIILGNGSVNGATVIDYSRASTSTTSGALVVNGGIGAAGSIYAGAIVNVGSNLSFTGTIARITGDFSNNTTITSRTMFQTSTTNSGTAITAIPNGTSAVAAYVAVNNSDPTNGSYIDMIATSTFHGFRSAFFGSGTYLPMTFQTGGSERVRIDNNGNVLVGTANTTAYSNLTVAYTTPSTSTTTGALVVAGGAGIGGNLYVGSNVSLGSGLLASGATAGLTGQKLISAGSNLPPTWATVGGIAFFTSGAGATWTSPTNISAIKITVQGPGGNGGSGGAGTARATGGGGGGTVIYFANGSVGGTTFTYTVGTASGSASVVTQATLAITLTAGFGANGAGTTFAASITAGAAGGSATGGNINIAGGQGGFSYGSSTTSATNFSGAGGNSHYGQGGAAVALVNNAGQNGTGFGGGGSGGHGSTTVGTGSGGFVLFEYW